MIIDVHCHIWERGMAVGEMEKMLHSINAHFGYQDPQNIFDGSPERLLADMDEAGIDKTVLLALDPEFTYRAEMTFTAYNDYVGDLIRQHGIDRLDEFVPHRTVGFGDSNWTDIISELRIGGFAGSIDIEGWHDPAYCDELEMMGQVHGLNYLKRCRGGSFVPSPEPISPFRQPNG